jgi:proteasome lid subunit RPN8/RPN11
MHQEDNLLKSIKEFSESSPLREACGFISEKNGELIFEKAINFSDLDDYFMINPVDFLERKLSGELVAIFHTHINGEENPSEYDILNSKNCLYPFLIYSLETEKFFLYDEPHFERSEKSVLKLKEIIND